MSQRQADSGRTPESERSPVPLTPLGLSLSATAARYGIDRKPIWLRRQDGTFPIVQVGPRCRLVLHGDHEVLVGEMPRGLETIARAAAGRTVLTVPEVGILLGVSRCTAENLVAAKDMPSFLDELGRRLVPVREFRAWLRDRRKPTRWERTPRRGAA